MNKHYILAIPSDLRGKLLDYSRLYAYPVIPELELKNGKVLILDSGAFGLSKQKREIDINYMKQLNEHYKKFNGSDSLPIIAVAPDKYLDPIRTMDNFKFWKNQNYCNIAPVLQCNEENKINLNFLKIQVDFYANYTKEVILFSNPGLTGLEMRGQKIEDLFKYIKNIGFKWIHILGAGWFPEDIANYDKIRFFDSIDTIQYYKSAKINKLSWDKKISSDYESKALSNAKYGNYLLNSLRNKILGINYV